MISTKKAAAILGISTARLCLLLQQGRVSGAIKQGRFWMIPINTDGKPEISDKHKGPRGSWTRVKRPVKKVIHVNTHLIRSNQNNTDKKPVISVKFGSKENLYTNYVEVLGLCKVIYQPDQPLNAGARVWIETEADVSMPYGYVDKPPSVQKAKTPDKLVVEL